MQDSAPSGVGAPPQSPKLDRTEVWPADVLLSRGTGDLADTIVAADRGSYSHAALWSGEHVIEATLDGIAERPLRRNSDVYRYQRDGKALDAERRAAIVQTARAYCGAPYAHGELLMLGALFAMGRRPERPLVAIALELLGGPEAVELVRLADQVLAAQGRVPMVCSELVARAYYEVDPSPAYALRVSRSREHVRAWRGSDPLAPGQRSAAAVFAANDAGDLASFDRLEQRCRELLATPSAVRPVAGTGERKVLLGEVAIDAITHRPVPVVTPGDLQFSPDLTLVGRLLAG